MILNRNRIRRILVRSLGEIKHTLSEEAQCEMAVPSYLRGNRISQWVAWKKIDHVLRMCGNTSGLTVMDFGCGTGILFDPLSQGCVRLYGVDNELGFARITATQLPGENIILLDPGAVASEVPDCSLDVIIAANVLEHLTSTSSCIDQFAAKSKQRGILIVCGPTENALYRLGRLLLKLSGFRQFTGNYHVRSIDHVLGEIRSRKDYQETGRLHFPGPGPFALYRIVKFRKQ